MKRILTLLLKAFGIAVLGAPSAHAATQYVTVDAYVSRAFGVGAGEAQLSTEGGRQPKDAVFGIAYGRDSGNRHAFVFVLRREPNGRLTEVARSKAFDFSDPSGRTDIEGVQAQSDETFSVQINSRSVCGVYVNKYRFARRGGMWKVVGLDSTKPTCGKNGEVQVAATRSSNFLTGRVVETEFSEDRETSDRADHVQFPSFPLSEFDPWDDRYAARY